MRTVRRWYWSLDIRARRSLHDALWFAAAGLCATLTILALP